MKKTPLVVPLLMLTLAACVQANAGAEKAAEATPAKVAKETKVIVINDADGKTFKWDNSQSPAELEKALAELPVEIREKVRKLISRLKMSTPGESHMLVKTLDSDDLDVDVNVVTDKIVMHKMIAGEGHEFELIKKLLAKGKFSKEQLQELQKQLDSKF